MFLARIAARAGEVDEAQRQLAIAHALDPLIADFVDEFEELDELQTVTGSQA